MSADEIKALAQQAFDDGIPSPSHRAGLLYIEGRCKQYAAALLSYAAMVERCEKARRKLVAMTDRNSPTWSYDSHVAALNDIDKVDYILKGAKDGK